jgi:hypothetical protein
VLIRGVETWKRTSGYLCEQTPAPLVLEHRCTRAVGVAVAGRGVRYLCQPGAGAVGMGVVAPRGYSGKWLVSQSLIGMRSWIANP